MKRKDWKTKNLKKDTYDSNIKNINKRYPNKNKYFKRERLLFLRKLFIRRNRFLIRKNLVFNYFFYRLFFNNYKIKKQTYFYNLFLKNKKHVKSFLPEFSMSKNVFNIKNNYKIFAKKHSMKYIFIPNKFNKDNVGISFYTKSFRNKNKNFLNLNKDLNDDLNKNLIQFKDFDTKNNFIFTNELNFYFNYNLNIMCNLEIYKILIILYINQIDKKN